MQAVLKPRLLTFNFDETSLNAINGNPVVPKKGTLQIIIFSGGVNAVFHVPYSKLAKEDLWLLEVMHSMGTIRESIFITFINLWFFGKPDDDVEFVIEWLNLNIGDLDWREYIKKNRGKYMIYDVLRQRKREVITTVIDRTVILSVDE